MPARVHEPAWAYVPAIEAQKLRTAVQAAKVKAQTGEATPG